MGLNQGANSNSIKPGLDSLNLKELKRAYYHSMYLKWWGIFCYILVGPWVSIFLVSLFTISSYSCSDVVVVLIAAARSIFDPISGYVYRSLRTNLAKRYMRLYLILNLLFIVACDFSILISTIIILIIIAIYYATYNPLLFGEEYYTHSQIKMAYKSLKEGKTFVVEKFLANPPPSTSSNKILTAGFILLGVNYTLNIVLLIMLILKVLK